MSSALLVPYADFKGSLDCLRTEMEVFHGAFKSFYRLYGAAAGHADAGERELGYKAWEPWDQWLPYTSENAGDFSAVGVYNRAGIPAKPFTITLKGENSK